MKVSTGLALVSALRRRLRSLSRVGARNQTVGTGGVKLTSGHISRHSASPNLLARSCAATLIIALFTATPNVAAAQAEKMNFRDRQAVVIDNASQLVTLSGFRFQNEYSQSRIRLHTDLSWKNTSSKAITAFEVVILRYDPFNRPLYGGGRWLVTGHNSGDWTPLSPGQSSNDGLLGFDDEPVLTSVVYVRAIRFEDGSVWNFDPKSVEKAIHDKLPILKDIGNVNPPIDEAKKK